MFRWPTDRLTTSCHTHLFGVLFPVSPKAAVVSDSFFVLTIVVRSRSLPRCFAGLFSKLVLSLFLPFYVKLE